MTIKEMKEKREQIAKANRKEYSTRGNTQRCQELFSEIMKIDEELKSRGIQ